MSKILYKLSELDKKYEAPGGNVHILDKVTLDIMAGESLAIIGSSGSGKSTLLHILGTLDVASSGQVEFMGKELGSMNSSEKAAFRNQMLGFVFQFHCLMPEFSTRENVAMPAIISGTPKKAALNMADEALALVGLDARKEHRVTTLSGGERQRAAIARAILNKPKVLLADEPTGNLDEKTAEQAAELLHGLNRQLGMTMVVVTHNPDLAASMGRCLELKAGKIHEKRL